MNTGRVVEPPVTWRPVLPSRAFGVVFVLFMCFATAESLIGLANGDGLDLLPGLAIFPIAGVLAWRMAVSSWLRLTSTEVIVRNPVGVVRIPLREITVVIAGYGGITIMRADRTRVGAWAVQKTNLASWLHWHTRADDVAETILTAAREAGAQLRVRPAAQQSVRKELRAELRRYPKNFHARHGE